MRVVEASFTFHYLEDLKGFLRSDTILGHFKWFVN